MARRTHEANCVRLCTQLRYAEPVARTDRSPGAPRLGTRELRANLAATVRRAAAGERVVITDSGRPVAQIGPLDAPAGTAIEELVVRGFVIAPRRAVRDTKSVLPEPIDTYSGMRFDQVVRDLR